MTNYILSVQLFSVNLREGFKPLNPSSSTPCCQSVCVYVCVTVPLWLRRLVSTGLKWIVGIGQTSCIGSASTSQAFFISQPAPCRYRPFTSTPSYQQHTHTHTVKNTSLYNALSLSLSNSQNMLDNNNSNTI